MSLFNSGGMDARTRADREVGVAPVDGVVERMVFPVDEEEDIDSGVSDGDDGTAAS